MGILILLLILIVILILTGIIMPIVGGIKMYNNNENKESVGYLTGKKYLRIGLGILIFTVVALIIGFSICLSTFSLGPMR